MSKIILTIEGIDKTYQTADRELPVLEKIHLELREEERLCLLGHSGCGKTTLLRIICGFEKADAGRVLLEGREYSEPSRDMIMLFQDFNQLLPWKTVQGNIVHSLRVTGLAQKKKEAKERAYEILSEVGLREFCHAYPGQLSGGMKQRAAFARAVVLKPKVLVMDEPFASLDYGNRRRLQTLTSEMCRKHGIAVLFVTHDIEEAILMADRIAIMEAGPGRIKEVVENTGSSGSGEKTALRLHLMESVS